MNVTYTISPGSRIIVASLPLVESAPIMSINDHPLGRFISSIVYVPGCRYPLSFDLPSVKKKFAPQLKLNSKLSSKVPISATLSTMIFPNSVLLNVTVASSPAARFMVALLPVRLSSPVTSVSVQSVGTVSST